MGVGDESKAKKAKKLKTQAEPTTEADAKAAAKKAKQEAKVVDVQATSPAAVEDKVKKEKKSAEEKAAKKAKKEAKKAKAEQPEKEEEPKKNKKEKKEKKDKNEKKRAAETTDEPTAKKAKMPEASEAPAPAPAMAGDEENARVFVGNLPFSMTDDWIKEIFAEAGAISEVHWMTHADTGRFKGSGFLTFESAAAAQKAVVQNGVDCEGRPMKVEVAAPRKQKVPGVAAGGGEPGEPSQSIFIGNLAWTIDEDKVRAHFAECGAIEKIKWMTNRETQEFMGKGFVDFESIDAATKAVALDGTDLCGRPVRINFSKSKPKQDSWGAKENWGNKAGGRMERPYKPTGEKPDGCVELFCGNLPWSIDDDKITAFFKPAGTVVETRWLNDRETGEFKGVGFVKFETTEMVDKAIELGGNDLEGRPIRIDYAGKKKDAW